MCMWCKLATPIGYILEPLKLYSFFLRILFLQVIMNYEIILLKNTTIFAYLVSLSLYVYFVCYWIDVDECNTVDLNTCGYGSECQNTLGSFMCPCLDGFNATVDGQCEGNGNLLTQSDV